MFENLNIEFKKFRNISLIISMVFVNLLKQIDFVQIYGLKNKLMIYFLYSLTKKIVAVYIANSIGLTKH